MKKNFLLLFFIYQSIIASFGQSTSISTKPIDRYIYCTGSRIKVIFDAVGNFQANNTFNFEMTPYGQNNYSVISSVRSGDTLIVTLPNKVITQPNVIEATFQYRITSSRPRTESNVSNLSMTDKITLNFSGEIQAQLNEKVLLQPIAIGYRPYTVTFSNGETVTETQGIGVYVNPGMKSQNYVPVSASNACGTGTVLGSQQVNVQPIDLRISSTNLPSSFCKGGFFYVHLIKSGKFNPENRFTVQCRSSNGSFQNCETTVENDSVLKAQIPVNTTIESISYLRISASSPAVYGSEFTSYTSIISRSAKLKLSEYFSGENPALIIEGERLGNVTYTFSNGLILSSNSGIFYQLPPNDNFQNYQLISAKDQCGEIPIIESDNINIQSVSTKSIFAATPQISFCKTNNKPISIPVFFQRELDKNGSFQVTFYSSNEFNATYKSTLPANLSDDKKNIVVDFPSEFFKNYEKSLATNFWAKIFSTNTKAYSDYIPVYIAQTPTANICCDGTVNSLGIFQLNASFTGGGPYKLELNDGTTGTFYDQGYTTAIEIFPKITTDYSIKSISNACGVGNPTKSIATVRANLSTDYTITLDTKTPDNICAGKSIDIYFNISGKIPDNANYKVELFNKVPSAPNFIVVGQGSKSPIKIQIPSSINTLGTNEQEQFYKYIRVVSEDGVVKSNFLPLNVKSLPTANLSSKVINVGNITNIEVSFKGGEPFYYSFNNEPEELSVSNNYIRYGLLSSNGYIYPTRAFQEAGSYKITSIRNECGVGTISNNAIQVKPYSIEINNKYYQTNVCKGGVYPIQFNIIGSNEQVKPIAQISLNNNSYSDLEIVQYGNPIWVRIPKDLQENNYYVRLKLPNEEIFSQTISYKIHNQPSVSMTAKNGGAIGIIEQYQTEYDCIKLQANTIQPWELWIDNLPSKFEFTYSQPCITVRPTQATTYKINKLVNACGFFDAPNNEVKVDFKPSITVNNNFIEACSGGNINFKFTTRGAFNANGNFSIYLIDNTNKEYTLEFLKEASYDGSLTLPSSLKEGYYNIMVKGLAANNQVISSNTQQVLIYPKPSAEIIDGSTIINSNRSVGIPFKSSFPNGTVNLILSDGRSIKVNGWGTEFSQKPSQTSVYELKSVANICGIEAGKGKFTVYVNPESSKKVDINASSREICAGESISINFSVEGTIVKERLKLQLSDEKGENYKTIPTTYNATYNNLTGIIPADTKEGTNYRLKIFDPSDSEVQGSSSPYALKIKPNFTVKITPTKPYYTDDASAEITLELSGAAPWSVIYGDSTGNNNRSVFVNKSPYILSLKPNNNVFYYKIFRVQSNTCASGVLSGTNPFLIELLTANSIEKPVANIYPNPTIGILELADEKTPKEIIIRNELGKHIKSISEQQDLETMKIEVSELPAGIYFIEIIHPEKTHKFKFIKL